MRLRCSICGNWDWLAYYDWFECSHCRLMVRDVHEVGDVARDLVARLKTGTIDLERDPAERWTLDPAGSRNAAWRFGFEVEPIAVSHDEVRFPPDYRPARAYSTAATTMPHDIGLGIMARSADAADIVEIATDLRDAFARIVILLDGTATEAGEIAARLPWVEVAHHPLAGDFAAQRNRLQNMMQTRWVLQIDTDERPDAALLGALGWLVAAADRDGLRSLGLPRRNLVDGVQSASYPDIQYRLNRSDIRFAGRVHERPVVPFVESSLALAGALEHRLDGERVRERTRIYEAMSTGAGRPEDEGLLLAAFDPVAVR
ncbi:hypothetical protein EQZ23_04185 [Sphingomonas sp. UV9]|uniref:hypothetical protein n=1 Tax=Sphingomonas sp. UV9 TaxID=1851410 RepID=UPI000FFCA211|nr:hypothetical protein [Sphingomonas sp. UV9]RXD07268.1 hypothetical protein EQZ23_04185 [Sphingomonas sp. UV9]